MNSTLSNRLKYLREKSGLAQKFVAAKLDIKPNTLSGYESGRREPDTTTLKALADFYDVSTDYLVGKKEKDYFSEAEAIMFKDIDGFNELSPEKQQEIKDMINRQLKFFIEDEKRDS